MRNKKYLIFGLQILSFKELELDMNIKEDLEIKGITLEIIYMVATAFVLISLEVMVT